MSRVDTYTVLVLEEELVTYRRMHRGRIVRSSPATAWHNGRRVPAYAVTLRAA